jgi:type IV secretion system protein TrbJ
MVMFPTTRKSRPPGGIAPGQALGLALMAAILVQPLSADAQLVVQDPANLVQTSLNAARSLEQISNQVTQITHQIRQLENDARNLSRLGATVSPDLIQRLREMDELLGEARGLALEVGETRRALETLYTGRYRGTDMAARAETAARQIDAARSALETSLLVQARTAEQLRADETTLASLMSASAGAEGALSAAQSANEILAFQAQQSMRLQSLLLAESRAEALERAREMDIRAQGVAQREHFFSSAGTAHPGRKPWP